jgi:DNA-binding FrmR family transcriptional regulator
MQMTDRAEPLPQHSEPAAPGRNLADEAKTRLRRIEGQVRGIQAMLDRMAGTPVVDEETDRRAHELLDAGEAPSAAARTLGITRQQIGEIVRRRDQPVCDPCDNLLTQILAVRAAVEQVGLLVLELHLQNCVLNETSVDDQRLQELRETLKLWAKLT